MKLVTYATAAGSELGVSHGGQVYPATGFACLRDFDTESLKGFLNTAGDRLAALSEEVKAALTAGQVQPAGSFAALRLLAPVINPEKVLCVGLNYADHVAETGSALPKYPDLFAKFASSLIGPQQDIVLSDFTPNLDFEGEVALVIGRPARNVPEAEAMDYVAGLMVLNDITARDLQYRGTQWLPGKAVDASTPCGPELVTLDEIPDPQQLNIRTLVNGVQVQSSNTRHMIFRFAHLVSYISGIMSLNPGDIITTGTPEGIGAKRTPPLWLKAGDLVEVEAEAVGKLQNIVK